MKRQLSGPSVYRNALAALLGTCAALIAGATAYAHHSQVAVYKTSEEQKIEGKLAQVLIRSPHSWVHIEGKDEKGQPVRWAIEWGGAAADHRLLMMFIERPSDGWNWGNKPGEVVD
jgi:hypothetical protein